VPARCSLITGLYPHRYPKQADDKLALQEGFWSVAHALRNAGYQTGAIGKGHYMPIHARHGFEKMRMVEHIGLYNRECVDDYMRWLAWEGKCDWRCTHLFGNLDEKGSEEQKKGREEYIEHHSALPFPYDKRCHPTDWVKRETIDFLEQRDPDRPYFLMTSFPHPHGPFDLPEPYDTLYDPKEARLPADGLESAEGLPPEIQKMISDAKGYGFKYTSDLGEELTLRMLTYVRALIKQIDDAVGEIIEHVDLDNTVVFFTTDHGDFYGHRGLFGKSITFPSDDLAHVPLFCSGAGIPEGKHVSSLVQSFDFAPTCLKLAGLELPELGGVDRAELGLDARSLTEYFNGEETHDDRIVYTSSVNRVCPMVRRRNLKYFRHIESGEELLVDVEKDPGETVNRIDDPAYAQDLADLRAALDRILAQGIPDLPRMDTEMATLDFRVD
jgi:arylsulfatase